MGFPSDRGGLLMPRLRRRSRSRRVTARQRRVHLQQPGRTRGVPQVRGQPGLQRRPAGRSLTATADPGDQPQAGSQRHTHRSTRRSTGSEVSDPAPPGPGSRKCLPRRGASTRDPARQQSACRQDRRLAPLRPLRAAVQHADRQHSRPVSRQTGSTTGALPLADREPARLTARRVERVRILAAGVATPRARQGD